MAGTNITRAEAAQRSATIATESYQVELDLTTSETTFRSTTTIRFTAKTDSTWIDLIAPVLHSVELNGAVVSVPDYDGHRIPLSGLASDNTVTVVADCAYMNTGEGLHRFVDPVDDEVYLYSQFETADTRRGYACFEQPDLKATFRLSVIGPDHWKVISNAATPAPVPAAPGTARWEFPATPRMSTYITALVAGPYAEVRDTYQGAHGVIPLGLFCRRSLAEFLEADDLFRVTKQGFEFFEREFDTPYPFGKYDQLFVPEFNAGAMENAGCVTFHEDYIFRSRTTYAAYENRANTVLHEMAHMWFGDLVTMQWWDDLWLNESFADWASHFASVRATRYVEAWTAFAIQSKAWAYRQDQLPSTHPIAADMVDLDSVMVNFDGITYSKGASALKQLVAWVGEEEFLTGLRAYFREYAWGNTRLPDLLGHLEAASGRDLTDWTRQWLQTSGVNLLRPDLTVSESGVIERAVIRQEPPAMPPGLEPMLRDHRIGVALFRRDGARLERTDTFEVDVTGAETAVPQLLGLPRPDLLLLNDGDHTFAKIRLDEHSVTTAIAGVADIDDPLARTLIWGAVWDMTRDAELGCSDFVRLVISAIGREPDVAVVQTTLRQTKAAINQYGDPERRADYSRQLAEFLWTAANNAEHGSDHQLAFVRAFASFADTDADLERVAALLAGGAVLPELAVDTELRWTFVHTLAAAGRDADALIAAELERDDTAAGRRHQAGALAARPTPTAKSAAWEAIVHDTNLPNAILDSMLGEFSQAGQERLLVPYRDRYFDTLTQIWKSRTPETAQAITTALYPVLLVDDETVSAADRFLADPGIHPSAARLVSEGRDGTLRALRARARDRAA